MKAKSTMGMQKKRKNLSLDCCLTEDIVPPKNAVNFLQKLCCAMVQILSTSLLPFRTLTLLFPQCIHMIYEGSEQKFIGGGMPNAFRGSTVVNMYFNQEVILEKKTVQYILFPFIPTDFFWRYWVRFSNNISKIQEPLFNFNSSDTLINYSILPKRFF